MIPTIANSAKDAIPLRHFYLLRGLIRESRHWGKLPELLRQAFPGARVTALDIPGAGVYFQQRSPARVAEMVQALRQDFLRTQGDEAEVGGEPVLVAISLGGMIASHWLQAHPADFRQAVLINTSVGGLSPLWQRLRPAALLSLVQIALTPEARQEAVILGLVSNNAAVFEEGFALWNQIRRERPVSRANTLRQLLAATRFRLADQTPPALPVLVLGSTRDRMVSVKCSRTIARTWQVPLREHNSAGHDLSLDNPAWIVSEMHNFLHDSPAPNIVG